jgi:predicted DNA-binding transcriptional regulator AlpA
MSDAAKLMNVKQVAERLAVSERTIWRLVQDDREFPKPLYLRAVVRWRVCDVDAYIDRKAGASAA